MTRKAPNISPFIAASLLLSQVAHGQSQQPTRKELLEKNGIVWGSAKVWGQPFQENLPEDLKIAGLGRFWLEAKINFPNFAAVPDLDWDATNLEYIGKVRATKSTYEYYKVLQQMCALLQDGHSNVFLPQQLAETMEVDVPFEITDIEGHIFITRINSKSLAKDLALEGSEILKIDGVPVADYANQHRRPYISSNSPQHREVMTYSYGLLAGPKGTKVQLGLKGKNGQVFQRHFERKKYDDVDSRPVFEFKVLSRNVAYVAINTFGSEDSEKLFIQTLPEIRKCNSLIIDVRRNEGGSGIFAYDIIGHLTDKDFDPGRWKSRQFVPTLRAWGNPGGWYESPAQNWKASPENFYSGPVIMLTGPKSLSATDVFAATFRRINRGLIIGEPTGGSTGDPLAFPLPGGGMGRISTSANMDNDLVGKGIIPDILVPQTAVDFVQGNDRILERALAEMQKLSRG